MEMNPSIFSSRGLRSAAISRYSCLRSGFGQTSKMTAIMSLPPCEPNQEKCNKRARSRETHQRTTPIHEPITEELQDHRRHKNGESAPDDRGIPGDHCPGCEARREQAGEGHSERAVENERANSRRQRRRPVLARKLAACRKQVQRNEMQEGREQQKRDQRGFGQHQAAST